MFEAGPQLTDDPGRERPQHRRSRREGARARDVAGPAGGRVPRDRSASRQGVGRGGHVHRARRAPTSSTSAARAPAHAADLPGRGGRRRTSAVRARTGRARSRAPAFSEKIPFIDDAEWDDLIESRRRPAARAERRVRRLRRSARRSGPCSRRSSPESCPRATGRAPCRSRATRSRTARCAGPVPTSCSARSSIRPHRSPRASSCATCRSSAASSARAAA